MKKIIKVNELIYVYNDEKYYPGEQLDNYHQKGVRVN